MSTIAAGTSAGTALVSTGDTTGALVLQTNGTTTAVTIATNQVVTLAQPLPVGSGGTGATSLSGLTTGTATNLAGGSNGTIPYQSATGTTQMLAVGTSGQVLQTNGAGAPSWVTPSAGALTFLASVNVSGSSTGDFTSQISSSYDMYLLTVAGLSLNGGSYVGIRFFVGGSIDTSGTYQAAGTYYDASGTVVARGGQNQSLIQMSNAANNNLSGSIYIFKGATSALRPTVNFQIGGGSTIAVGMQMSGSLNSNVLISGIRILNFGGGTFDSGTLRLYGISNS